LRIAITREVSPNINQCELTHVARETIDIDLARKQHTQYQKSLSGLGCEVICLPADPRLPDSVFVEDTAVVLDDLAIITRPGAASRRPEVLPVIEALKPHRELVYIDEPGTLDGGDVLHIGRTLYVGITGRTNRAAAEQMREVLTPLGHEVIDIRISGCLHLKSAVTQVSEDILLINRDWVTPDAFENYILVDIDPSEPYGANALLVGNTVIYPKAFPHTCRRLEAQGIEVINVDLSELAKAEGAATCCSLVLKV
jgi:dimethylargininase